MVGKRSSLPQSKFPPSTTAPPMAMPCPPIHFVREWMMMLAPSAIGFSSHGVLKVQSSISGTCAFLPISATAATSITSRPGLPITSPKMIFVFGWIAASMAARSSGATKVVVMPKRGRVFSRRLMLAPYMREEATIWSPDEQMVITAVVSAAMPDAVAVAATPPSSAATRCSSTATVGFEMRV